MTLVPETLGGPDPGPGGGNGEGSGEGGGALVTRPINLTRVPGAQRPSRPEDWMLRQLPMQMLSNDFFVRFVSIFQELGSSLLEDADQIDHLIDLTVTSPEMVRWMGSWIAVPGLDPEMAEALQRRIVASAARTLAWRGTARGLAAYLELVSGAEAQVEEGGGVWRAGERPEDTAWVRMWVSSTGALPADGFVAMIRDEVPAHVRAQLHVGDDLVWDSENDEEW